MITISEKGLRDVLKPIKDHIGESSFESVVATVKLRAENEKMDREKK